MDKKKQPHLTAEERYQISALHRNKIGNNEIARQLGRDKGTISRELSRNKGSSGYHPKQAQTKATERRSSVCKATINSFYRYIHAQTKRGRTLTNALRGRHKYRKRYGSGRECRGRIPLRRGIEERAPEVETRERLGDFEGDTVIGKHHQGAIATVVDRKSRLLQAAPLPNKSAAGVTQACIAMLGDKRAHTITFDNGSEFSQHAAITDAIRVEVFFAKPYCSWQRGTNENTNGLLRQFFPKNMPLNNVCEADVNDAVQLINSRPRKVLGWKTPIEVWADG